MDENQKPAPLPANLPTESPSIVTQPKFVPPQAPRMQSSQPSQSFMTARPPVPPPPPKTQPTSPNVPPPPSREAFVRTMKSDSDAVSKGEAMPKPQMVMPSLEKKLPLGPETTTHMDTSIFEEEPPKSGRWFWLIIVVLAVLVLGAGGYYFFSGYLATPTTPTPVVSETPGPTPQPLHQSFFITAPSETKNITLNSYSLADIQSALKGEVSIPLPNKVLKEVVPQVQGKPASFGQYINALLPGIAANSAARWFEEDFTSFLYYDTNGAWPGYIAKIRSEANIAELKNALSSIEVADLSSFYLSDPGQISGFKDGKVFEIYPTRYATWTQKGAAFNYAVITDRNYLIFSASYDGLREAIRLLGVPMQ